VLSDCCSLSLVRGIPIPQSYLKHTARSLTLLFPEAVKIMSTLRHWSIYSHLRAGLLKLTRVVGYEDIMSSVKQVRRA
jgi:hypothetical protein